MVVNKSLHNLSFFCMKLTRALQGDTLGGEVLGPINPLVSISSPVTQGLTFDKVFLPSVQLQVLVRW
jgi:hypothetical protein